MAKKNIIIFCWDDRIFLLDRFSLLPDGSCFLFLIFLSFLFSMFIKT